MDAPEILRRKWIVDKFEGGEGCVRIASETGVAVLEIIQILREETGYEQPML